MKFCSWAVACFLFLVGCSPKSDPSLLPEYEEDTKLQIPRKELAYPNPQNQVFFGDLHIHTSLSTDAYVFGSRVLPNDAYVYAKGGAIEHGAGYKIQASKPLDFAAVTDHAEYLGQARQAGLDIPTNRQSVREILLNSSLLSVTISWLKSVKFIDEFHFGYGVDIVDEKTNRQSWQMTIDAAEYHNDPGRFTAFIGYEWSAFAGSPRIHVHRNVIYKGSDVSDIPFSSLDSNRPEDLWGFLNAEETEGREAFAIPHNANLSNGNMYATVDSDGRPFTKEYADIRNRYEPLSEIFQVKGSSEVHPLLAPLDEFAGFELTTLNEETVSKLSASYARSALKKGLELQDEKGINPYRFGVIGSSDSHNGSSPSEEAAFHGKLPLMDGSAGIRTDARTLLPKGINPAPSWSSGGLVGVWAKENTRESLYSALKNKETFATSGPRISVRFFGSWTYDLSMDNDDDAIEKAYSEGVPMGGELSAPPTKTSKPKFFVMAIKDPDGANLDRIQIVKAWVDNKGASREKIYDVAWSDSRDESDQKGALISVGNTVNENNATYSNTIGSSVLSVIWEDEGFSPSQNALYYARVIEIPTPRWSTYDAVLLGNEPVGPVVIQERAVTSPIWYIK